MARNELRYYKPNSVIPKRLFLVAMTIDATSNYKKGAIVNRVNRQLHLMMGIQPKSDGGDGNRTRVREQFNKSYYMLSISFGASP